MKVSIEIPVFKGAFLQPSIDSVLAQTSDQWTLSLVWDGGDALSREILQKLVTNDDPRIRVYFTENQGIARARAFLSAQTQDQYILPLDDDDVLSIHAVERLLAAAQANPWASLIRAKRNFIDTQGEVVEQQQWFPFGPRNYYKGMVTDVFNQAQPYLIRRSAYERTQGWRGFDDFMQAGEDCDIFLQLEQVGHFELIDEVLYHYRLHDTRASDELTSAAAFEMWRRLADESLARMQLPLQRISEMPPFRYQAIERSPEAITDIDFVVPTQHGPAADALRRAGVEEKYIIALTARLTNTCRTLVCFVNDDVEILHIGAIETLFNALNDQQADMVTPRLTTSRQIDGQDKPQSLWIPQQCLLVRKEVISATGGFDHCCVPAALQGVDFWIQALRRGFTCIEVPLSDNDIAGDFNIRWSQADKAMLERKWHSHQSLLDQLCLSSRSGAGALR